MDFLCTKSVQSASPADLDAPPPTTSTRVSLLGPFVTTVTFFLFSPQLVAVRVACVSVFSFWSHTDATCAVRVENLIWHFFNSCLIFI